MRQVQGDMYLLHLDVPYVAQSGKKQKWFRHYLGVTFAHEAEKRIQDHRTGRSSSRTMRAVRLAGIQFDVAHIWREVPDVFGLERRVKRQKTNLARWCPICNPRWQVAHLLLEQALRRCQVTKEACQ